MASMIAIDINAVNYLEVLSNGYLGAVGVSLDQR
jgi:hypothetical protein